MADERKEEARVKYQLMPALVAYIVAAFVGFFVPRFGVSVYLLIAIWLAIPIRDVRKLFGRAA